MGGSEPEKKIAPAFTIVQKYITEGGGGTRLEWGEKRARSERWKE